MAKLNPNLLYTWEMETIDGTITPQYKTKGDFENENSWKDLDPDKIVRVSLIPTLPIFPKHSIIINHAEGEKFVRRFGRGFIKSSAGMRLAEYINCIVTNRYKLWVFSDGKCIVTDTKYDLNI